MIPHLLLPRILGWLKYSLYTLLACNIYLFFRHATFHEGLDSLGWILLLGLFEFETAHAGQGLHNKAIAALSALAYGMVIYAWLRYAGGGQWLDFVNASLWLAVAASIEMDIRYKHPAYARLHNAIKILLYTALVVVAILWGIIGDALNFYDAALWIACFFCIELNVLGCLLPKP